MGVERYTTERSQGNDYNFNSINLKEKSEHFRAVGSLKTENTRSEVNCVSALGKGNLFLCEGSITAKIHGDFKATCCPRDIFFRDGHVFFKATKKKLSKHVHQTL